MKVGTRFWSSNSTAQVIVVKSGGADADLTCAGVAMIAQTPGAKPSPGENPAGVAPEDMLLAGKRYVDAGSGAELLCTSAGAGPLCLDGRRLGIAEAKALPSSD